MNKKVKLVSLNMGISLVVLKEGKEHKVTYSQSSKNSKQPREMIENLCNFLMEELGIELWFAGGDAIQIVKPKAIKAPAPVSHEEFNKRIKELVG